MGSLVLYIIEWAFALLVLLAIYKAAFSGTTFHRFNRFYLLGATLLSALLPLVHVTIPDSTPMASNLSIEETGFAQELSGTFTFYSSESSEPQHEFIVSDAPVPPAKKNSLWAVMLICTYAVYVITLFTGWSRGIIRARRFLKGKPRRRLSHTVWLVTHNEQFGPFSWMNYIVISDKESGFARRASLRHEYSHVKLLHSIDLIILLACTIVNPVCWLVLQEIKIVHEYEADNEVINRYGIQEQDYQRLLIMRTVGAEAYALASSFNLNIKKRIIMMNKKKTLKRRLIWLLLLIPLLGMTSVLFARTEKAVNLDDTLRFTSGNAEIMRYRIAEPIEVLPYSPITTVLNGEGMYVAPRNLMQIMVNKNDEIYVSNGLLKRVITLDELKPLAKQFIQNPDNDDRLPSLEEYEIPGYGTVTTTIKHIFSLQYDRSSLAGLLSDIRYELHKAYKEVRNEVCISKFGKEYDDCSESEQDFARAMYAMKISDAQPVSYDGEGNRIVTEVRSAAVNPEEAKTNKVNKDLRIRVYGNPAWIYASTVLFDSEYDQELFRSETIAKKIRVNDLDGYIDQAISDGMKIRNVRLEIHPEVLMGDIVDLKEIIRHRMLLNIVEEGYLPIVRNGNYDYNEITIYIQTQGLSAEIIKFSHNETGIDECVVGFPRRPVELNELEDFLDSPDFVKEDLQQVTLMVWPNSSRETLSEVQKVLKKKRLLNVRYQTPRLMLDTEQYSTSTEKSNWIGVEVLPTASEQYVVECFGGDFKDAEPVENLEKVVKDLFVGKRHFFVIPYSEDNFRKVKEVIGQYPDKKVNWM